MTTAGRPTWNAARGSADQGGRTFVPTKKYSSKDMPGRTFLKLRQPGQGTMEEVKERDLVAQLQERDKKPFEGQPPIEIKQEKEEEKKMIEPPKGPPLTEEEKKLEPKAATKSLDADDSDDDSGEEDKSGSSANSSEDEDETEALMLELERIKKERAEEQARKEAESKQLEEEDRTEALLHSNPLLEEGSTTGDFTVKKRWYDDVVFKNQSRGEPPRKKRFINDTTRNDFHQQFLKKYVR